MRQTTIIAIVACAVILQLKNVQGLSNPGRFLSCWPTKLYFQQFAFDFYFSSRSHSYQRLRSGAVLGRDIDFNQNRKTAVIVHGMGGSSHEYNVKALVHHFLQWQDMNIIVMDWQRGSNGGALVYPQAAANTEFAAMAIRDLFIRLTEAVGKPPQYWAPVHFIGHSLGAHVVGQAAGMLNKANMKIARVTGMDPAEPCFTNANSPLRLKKSNAPYVDVIHTDAATAINERFGLRDQLGHADFYVNGGSFQPGCNGYFGVRRLDLNLGNILAHATGNGACHHNRALTLFVESVIQAKAGTCKFWAHPWRLGTSQLETSNMLKQKCNHNTCVEMGINSELYDHQLRGVYYVKTSGGAPYCNV